MFENWAKLNGYPNLKLNADGRYCDENTAAAHDGWMGAKGAYANQKSNGGTAKAVATGVQQDANLGDAGIKPDDSNTSAIDLSKCKKCGGDMVPGLATKQTYTGTPDFGPRDRVVTMSPGGPGGLMKCSKCSNCGWSTT
jgi:hypothetical protein